MLLTAERVLVQGAPRAGVGISIDANGRIDAVDELSRLGTPDVQLGRRLVVPGFVNAHSHAFQRLLRGRTQRAGGGEDNFWSWREVMYRVAGRLEPESLYAVARLAFVEMLLSGVTSVGEFHYLHHRPGGASYDDANALGFAVVRAARDAGMRLCLLDTVYLRGDFDVAPNELQRRFCDADLASAVERVRALERSVQALADSSVSVGVAAHSVRAVHVDDIAALKRALPGRPFHLHASEQRREVERCVAAHGGGPVEVLAARGVLDARTTLVHATHLRPGEAQLAGQYGATVCVCPSTEADLGDGLCDVSSLLAAGVTLALGTDGQTLSSILAEASRLEMHERLRLERRNVLVREGETSCAATALRAATLGGARALALEVGALAAGSWADLVAVDLDDPSLVGADDESLLAALVFSSDARAVRDVMVGGRFVVRDGRHSAYQAAASAYVELGVPSARG